jgi:hypothetical protein
MYINRRTVRGVGLSLVVLPEPFTTPVGVALILLSNFIKNTMKLYPRRWTVREPFSSAPASRLRCWRRPSGFERVRRRLAGLGGQKTNRPGYVCPHRSAGERAVVYRPLREHAHGGRSLGV